MQRILPKFLIILCCLSSFMLFKYAIITTELFALPWKPRSEERWSHNAVGDFHDQGVLREEQHQWRTQNLETKKEKEVLTDINMKQDISLPINGSKIGNNVTGERKLQTQKPPIRKNVIILSPGRSGSSFLGGIFNNHPNVLYWYEPLHTVLQDLFQIQSAFIERNEPKYYKEIAIRIINSFFQCDFGNITNSTLEAFSNTVMRKVSKALSGGKCIIPNCGPFTRTMLRKVCNSYNHTVVKVLADRLPNQTLQTLKELFKQPDRYEVKLIYLVRDPRAVMYSRVFSTKWLSHSDPNFDETVIRFCDTTLKNIRFGLISPPSWLKNRFKVIRYEDLALNAINISKDLYRFVDINWSTDIEEWINKYSTSENISEPALNDPHSLLRNPSEVIEKWKSAPEALIRGTEAGCGDLMNFLGYQKIHKKKKKNRIVSGSSSSRSLALFTTISFICMTIK